MQQKSEPQLPRVLVIDDNKGILFSLREALTLKGYDVVTSETFESITAVENIAPDLLYLDISLVGQDGREIARELKSDSRTQHIPIVILTAYPNAMDIAKEAGANDFLPKPFDLADLWKMTEKYCHQSPVIGNIDTLINVRIA